MRLKACRPIPLAVGMPVRAAIKNTNSAIMSSRDLDHSVLPEGWEHLRRFVYFWEEVLEGGFYQYFFTFARGRDDDAMRDMLGHVRAMHETLGFNAAIPLVEAAFAACPQGYQEDWNDHEGPGAELPWDLDTGFPVRDRDLAYVRALADATDQPWKQAVAAAEERIDAALQAHVDAAEWLTVVPDDEVQPRVKTLVPGWFGYVRLLGPGGWSDSIAGIREFSARTRDNRRIEHIQGQYLRSNLAFGALLFQIGVRLVTSGLILCLIAVFGWVGWMLLGRVVEGVPRVTDYFVGPLMILALPSVLQALTTVASMLASAWAFLTGFVARGPLP